MKSKRYPPPFCAKCRKPMPVERQSAECIRTRAGLERICVDCAKEADARA